MKENSPTFLDRKPLFPGKSCFPLSPSTSTKPKKSKNGFPADSNDQLAMIFNVIGTPSVEELSFVTDNMAWEYLQSFQYVPRADLSAKYPGACNLSIDFLNKTLVMNPFFRISMEEAVNHPLFDGIRTKENVQSQKIELMFEKMDLSI